VSSLIIISSTPITIGPSDIEGVVRYLKDPKIASNPLSLTIDKVLTFKK